MKYLTVEETAARWGVSYPRVVQLLREGRVRGAKRWQRSWMIPATAPKPPSRKGGRPKGT
jgi:excisionase family DNA binding protein